MFLGGFACLPFLWTVNAIWFFKEAFFRPEFEGQSKMKQCMYIFCWMFRRFMYQVVEVYSVYCVLQMWLGRSSEQLCGSPFSPRGSQYIKTIAQTGEKLATSCRSSFQKEFLETIFLHIFGTLKHFDRNPMKTILYFAAQYLLVNVLVFLNKILVIPDSA